MLEQLAGYKWSSRFNVHPQFAVVMFLHYIRKWFTFLGKDNLFQNKWKYLRKGVNIRCHYLKGWLLLALEKTETSRKWWKQVLSPSSLDLELWYTAGSCPDCRRPKQRPKGTLHRPTRRGPQACSWEKENALFELGSPEHPRRGSREWLAPSNTWNRRRNRNGSSQQAKCRKADQKNCLLLCEQQGYKKNFSAFQSTLSSISPQETLKIKLSTSDGGPVFIRMSLYFTPSHVRMILPPTYQSSSAGQPSRYSELKKSFFKKKPHHQPVFQK